MIRAAVTLALTALTTLAVCSKAPPAEPTPPEPAVAPWAPGKAYPTPREPNARGLLDLRGLIHAHSIYSHDACDSAPRSDAGVYDQGCLDDFRRGLCQSQHDFVFLTDHPSSFTTVEFPEALLYREARGDTLVTRGGAPVANFAGCPDGQKPALLMAGSEGEQMPVGLEHHVGATSDARRAVYNSLAADDLEKVKAAGAISLVAHTERFTPDQLAAMPLDGFEMFNVHANLFRSAAVALELVSRVDNHEPNFMDPNLVLLPIFTEDPKYLETWGTVLSRGLRRVTTMGSDCHRNSFPTLMSDGERVDSYRRMMSWFSNHLLVRPRTGNTWDDLELKQALKAGRLYGAFEVLGYPLGFDFHATEGAAVHEMGDQVSLAKGVKLLVTMPTLQGLDPRVEPPTLAARLLVAREGGWDTVKEGSGDLSFDVTAPGAYRVEIRMLPKHLKALLGRDAQLVTKDVVWVYSNPVYVAP